MLSRRLSRRGFTMIELMVAIGILIILVGILMFAMRSIGDSTKAANQSDESSGELHVC